MKGLDPHLTLAGHGRIPPCSTCRLQQERKLPFRRPKIAGEQCGIRVHGRHQGHSPEIMAFGDHLCAQQDINIAAVYGLESGLGAAFASGRVGIDAQHARARKGLLQVLLDSLRSTPERLHVNIAARRAGGWNAKLEAAVMAAQTSLGFVQHHEGCAAPAVTDPAARFALHHRRIATSIQKQERLLATFEPCP